MVRLLVLKSCLLMSVVVAAQGQDSTPYERDFLVIDAMLAGVFANANQSYFDRRIGREPLHASYEITITREAGAAHAFRLAVAGSDRDQPLSSYRLHLDTDVESGVVISQVVLVPPSPPPGAVADEPPPPCKLAWRRSAAEFIAEQRGSCHAGSIRRIILSERQIWLDFDGLEAGDLELHRARRFECYADIPGVGGGRDEAYDRYDGLLLHDQGGSAWFTTDDGRRLGISLLLVDWPINNYTDAFARDSLVVYVSEETAAGRAELGYAFTVPGADRIGLNLKWMLVNCFMQSNTDIRPYM